MAEDSARRGPVKIRSPLSGLWRIAVYYLILFGVAWVLAHTKGPGGEPSILNDVIFGFERLQELNRVLWGGGSPPDTMASGGSGQSNRLIQDALTYSPGSAGAEPEAARASSSPGDFGREFTLMAIISLLGGLSLMIPVAWVYLLTKQRRGYDESVVQAMLILPIAVAGIIFVVQFNIAVAFSLAGIVAAVRFRSTLQDTKDAVYVFLAIGVGVASGTLVLGLAAITSVVFNLVILYLYWSNFGNIYADQRSRTGAMGLADVLAGPGSAATAVSIGDPQLLDAMTQEEIRDVATRVARMERYLRAEQSRKKKERLNALLIVHAEQMVGAQALVDEILSKMASRWELAEILPGQGTTSVLEYLVRLNPDESPARLLELLKSAPGKQVLAAEYRSLEGMAIPE